MGEWGRAHRDAAVRTTPVVHDSIANPILNAAADAGHLCNETDENCRYRSGSPSSPTPSERRNGGGPLHLVIRTPPALLESLVSVAHVRSRYATEGAGFEPREALPTAVALYH